MAAAWVLAAAVVSAPHLKAALDPPPGRAFAGTFHWIDDFYNYASFVQQAEDGAVVFANKLSLEDQNPSLVNVEWTVVGWVSRLLGRRPFLAFRLAAVALLFALLAAADRALRRAGLPPTHRLAALLLVAFGGGLGGLLFELTPRSIFRSADLYVAFYPFLEALANPHWLAATWLLLESLLAFGAASSARGALLAVALGTALGLVRPYDLALLVAAHAIAVAATSPAAAWPRRLLPLAGLLPVVLYNYWAFYAIPTWRSFGAGGTSYASPPASDLLWALAPAALAALALRRPDAGGGEEGRLARAQLWSWAAVAAAVVGLRPVSFALQFAVGAGLPLLLLAALGLRRFPPWATVLAALVSASTAVVATKIVLHPDPNWHLPAERIETARLLRERCRPGEIAFAPPDVGLYALAYTSCRPFVSHPWEPEHADRVAVAASFYGAMAPATRSAILDRLRARQVVLPGDPGPAPEAWLGAGTAFRKVAQAGSGERALSVYAR